MTAASPTASASATTARTMAIASVMRAVFKMVICYAYKGQEFALDLEDLADKRIEARWMDPANGVYSYFGQVEPKKETTFTPPEKFSSGHDWALVLKY